MAEQQDDARQPFHVDDTGMRPIGPGHREPVASSFDPSRLDFGHHAGRTIEELAETEPDYLRWLERHPSGVRYRAEIQRVLGVIRRSTDWSP
jgi:broad specificity phosphatase PhoE